MTKTKFHLIALTATALVFSALYLPTYGTVETFTAKVDRLGEERCQVKTGCKYLEFANGEVFENTDTILFLKFNSSDVHAALLPGRTCDLKVAGWRVPFLSWYRNIISADCQK